jgi:hypothetical protein
VNMGKYCKAYPIARFREFGGWTEEVANLRPERKDVDGQVVETPGAITDDTYLFLQENHTVTDGIAIDEHVVFANVTPEWQTFCTDVLEFRVPEL